jgi:hypothetical protein
LLSDVRGRAQAFLAERIGGLPELTADRINEVAHVLEQVAARPRDAAADVAGTAPVHAPAGAR